MKINKIKELAEKIYYRRTGLDSTKADHEKNIDYAIAILNHFKKDICEEQRHICAEIYIETSLSELSHLKFINAQEPD